MHNCVCTLQIVSCEESGFINQILECSLEVKVVSWKSKFTSLLFLIHEWSLEQDLSASRSFGMDLNATCPNPCSPDLLAETRLSFALQVVCKDWLICLCSKKAPETFLFFPFFFLLIVRYTMQSAKTHTEQIASKSYSMGRILPWKAFIWGFPVREGAAVSLSCMQVRLLGEWEGGSLHLSVFGEFPCLFSTRNWSK